MFTTKHVGDIFVLWYFRDLKILKFLVDRRDVKCENISFLKFVFTLWVWSFVLGLSCDTGQSFRAASCGGSPHQSIPHTRIQPGPRFRGRWLWILSDTRPVAVASQHPSYGKTSVQLKLYIFFSICLHQNSSHIYPCLSDILGQATTWLSKLGNIWNFANLLHVSHSTGNFNLIPVSKYKGKHSLFWGSG